MALMIHGIHNKYDRQLATDYVMPDQYLTRRCPTHVDAGERRLWLAVIEDAFVCAAGRAHVHGPKTHEERRAERRRLQNQALAWVTSRSQRPQSFEWICDNLGLDADYLRRAIIDQNLRVFARRGRGNVSYINTRVCHTGRARRTA